MIIRVFSREELATGKQLQLDDKQSHYLVNVMRLTEKSVFFMFDGKNGEFSVTVTRIKHKTLTAIVGEKVADFYASPDIWLLFAPLKKDNTDLVIQKATELGVRKIIPIITAYTNSEKVRTERFRLQSIEAAEQSRRQDIPEICEPKELQKVINDWPNDRVLFFLNEKGNTADFLSVLQNNKGKAAVLVGPEGGFSQTEAASLLQKDFIRSIFLGKRILRAETAVISALSCWQAVNGDWQEN
jgi:16S rRNA (uracil1498-N3)-methyltransferase